jgi:acyl carrier protein
MSKQEDVEGKVLSVVSFRLGARTEGLSRAKSFFKDLCADSLDYSELLIAIEEEFGICISREEEERINTVGDLIDCVNTKLGLK